MLAVQNPKKATKEYRIQALDLLFSSYGKSYKDMDDLVGIYIELIYFLYLFSLIFL